MDVTVVILGDAVNKTSGAQQLIMVNIRRKYVISFEMF